MGSAPAPPRPVSLHVRAAQVSHLCFEVDGILEISVAQLGATVNAFDFPAFYAILGAMPTLPGDPSRLLYDFVAIDAAVVPFALMALRKEPRKVALLSAINSRQNAFFAKYANAPAIIAMMNNYYSPSVPDSKPNRLAILSALATDQFNQLNAAYTADKRLGVVKTTTSRLDSTTTSQEHSTTKTSDKTSSKGSTDQVSVSDYVGRPVELPGLPSGGGSLEGWGFVGAGEDLLPTETYGESSSGEHSSSSGTDQMSGGGSAYEQQKIVNTDYGYRVPSLEATAQMERAMISLMDQQFAQFMYGQNLPNLDIVFLNELNNMDGNVYRLQVSYLNTILMSPIAGTITGVYKFPGDAVKAGEPVVRVEDNSTILLVATVIYRGPIAIGSTVTVTTNLFDSSPAVPTTISGSVVSARGHRDDDKWDLVVKCNNLDSSSNPIFPLGYRFDYDDTSIAIG